MFYRGEIIEIIISAITISLAFSVPTFSAFHLVLLTVGLGFVLHELGHKAAASHFGYFAIYRAWMQGLVLAVIFAFVTAGRFVFAAPGAVYIWGRNITRREDGIISLAGPVVNYALAVFFLLLLSSPHYFVQQIAGWGFTVNAFLGLFNLLPIGPLDGAKVLRWNPTVWLIAFAFGLWMLFVL